MRIDREKDGFTVKEQLHMAALVTYTQNPVCVIDYEEAQGPHNQRLGILFHEYDGLLKRRQTDFDKRHTQD